MRDGGGVRDGGGWMRDGGEVWDGGGTRDGRGVRDGGIEVCGGRIREVWCEDARLCAVGRGRECRRMNGARSGESRSKKRRMR
jgi:hypothetical protein